MSEQHLPDDYTLTVNDVAERFRMKPATIRLWIREGKLPAKRFGERKYLIREADVAELVDQAGDTSPISAPRSDASSFRVVGTFVENQ
jgi:excisionase family DNA binding protein